eukprot:4822456-Pleurochrysis_carterae.AAC.2
MMRGLINTLCSNSAPRRKPRSAVREFWRCRFANMLAVQLIIGPNARWVTLLQLACERRGRIATCDNSHPLLCLSNASYGHKSGARAIALVPDVSHHPRGAARDEVHFLIVRTCPLHLLDQVRQVARHRHKVLPWLEKVCHPRPARPRLRDEDCTFDS